MTTQTDLKRNYSMIDESPVFDTVKLTAGTDYNSLNFFTDPQQGDVKTDVDTTLQRQGMLQANERFQIKGIKVDLNPDISDADAKVILKNTLLKFVKSGDQVIYKSPLLNFQIKEVAAIRLGKLIVFDSPINLEANVAFKVEIVAKPALQVAVDSYIKVMLEGYFFKTAIRG